MFDVGCLMWDGGCLMFDVGAAIEIFEKIS
jgi:hypothetical protein